MDLAYCKPRLFLRDLANWQVFGVADNLSSYREDDVHESC